MRNVFAEGWPSQITRVLPEGPPSHEALWFVTAYGRTFVLTTWQLHSPTAYQQACVESFLQLPRIPKMRCQDWHRHIRSLCAQAQSACAGRQESVGRQ